MSQIDKFNNRKRKTEKIKEERKMSEDKLERKSFNELCKEHNISQKEMIAFLEGKADFFYSEKDFSEIVAKFKEKNFVNAEPNTQENTEEAGFSKSGEDEKEDKRVIISVAERCQDNPDLEAFFKDNGFTSTAGVTKETFEDIKKKFEEQKADSTLVVSELGLDDDSKQNGNEPEAWAVEKYKMLKEEFGDDISEPDYSQGLRASINPDKEDKKVIAHYKAKDKVAVSGLDLETYVRLFTKEKANGMENLNIGNVKSPELKKMLIEAATQAGMSVSIDGIPYEKEEENKRGAEDAEIVDEAENEERALPAHEEELSTEERIAAAKRTIELRKKAFDGDASYAAAREVIKEATKDGAKFVYTEEGEYKIEEGVKGADGNYDKERNAKLAQSLAEWAKYKSIKDIGK